MTTRWLAFMMMISSAVLVTGGARDAHAGDMCVASCSTARRVCLAEAKTALKACAAACSGGADLTACKQTCRDALAQAKDACRGALDECHADCPPPPPNPASCSFACATSARSCFGDVLANGKACVQACRGSSGDALAGCLRGCADTLRGGAAACVDALHGCLAECQGGTNGACLDLKSLACAPDSCTLGAGNCPAGSICIPRCPPPPPPLGCFDVFTRRCTGTACSFLERCPSRHEICVPGCGGSPSGAFVE